jgi:hypothetical protein
MRRSFGIVYFKELRPPLREWKLWSMNMVVATILARGVESLTRIGLLKLPRTSAFLRGREPLVPFTVRVNRTLRDLL